MYHCNILSRRPTCVNGRRDAGASRADSPGERIPFVVQYGHMNVGGVGNGPPDLPNPLVRSTDTAGAIAAVRSLAASAGLGEDGAAMFFQGLAKTQITELFGLIEQTRLVQDPALLQGLLRTAVAAVADQDVPGAIDAVARLVTLSPERGAQMVNEEPALNPIRGAVQNLLQRLTLGAKSDAEQTLAIASQAIEMAAQRTVQSAGFDPKGLLAVADRLLETGQQINYVRAGELGQIVIAYCQVPVTEINASGPRKTSPAARRPLAADALADSLPVVPREKPVLERLKAIWRRGPLLILLLGWCLLGLIGATFYYFVWHVPGREPVSAGAVEIWVIGFLALVLFQFFVRTRNVKF